MMAKSRLFIGAVLLSLAAFSLLACSGQQSQKYTVEESERIARDFVQNEATFRFDGIADTLELTNTSELGAGSWEFTFRYDSRASGYGDRTGQFLLQVITPHEAKVTAKNYKVTKAIMDNRWDMIAQRLLGEQPTQTPPSPVTYSMPELRYRLIDNFGDIFYVDGDFYPIAREGQEERNAQERFSAIKADDAEFAAILQRLGLPNKADYALEEKVRIYREHKKLTLGVQITASRDVYSFTLRVGEGQGFRIEGTITTSGKITVLKKEPSINTVPICLTKGSLIDTPNGPVPVEQLRQGMEVWTADDMAVRVLGVVVETVVIPVPSSFQAVKVTLSDGRVVTASPGHPTIEKPMLGDYRVGDDLDGALVVAVERVSYNGETYDILPALSLPDEIGSTGSVTGFYWVNGVLMISTLAPNPMGQDMMGQDM